MTVARTMPVELASLCQLLRAALHPGHAASTAPQLDEPEWRLVANLASIHRVAALVDDAIPEAVRRPTSTHRLDALRQAGELIRVTHACRSKGIRVLSYKGPVLALQAYGSALSRVCSDLDLVIHPEDAGAALGLLHECGYQAVYTFTPVEHDCFRAVDGDYPLVHERSGALLELHCRVSSRRFDFDLETKDLWERRQCIALAGGEIETLGTEDQLLVLAVHGAKHRWRRLEWLAAFTALLNRADAVPVDHALKRAAEVGARRAFLLALRLASSLLGVTLTGDAAAQSQADRALARLADDAIATMVAEGAGGESGRNATRQNLVFNFRVLDSARARARYCANWLFVPTPEDWRAISIPRGLFAAHRAIRPVRLLATYMTRA